MYPPRSRGGSRAFQWQNGLDRLTLVCGSAPVASTEVGLIPTVDFVVRVSG
ncbi:hypothetical protein Fuma_02999 [Fuerstiella marisgermanici]|uniref:Uncharacterized protein n=1 Tax=Fuerstiella marisgermanici TaxID=1891926 RepID=A0A1P8WH51_9PLAN|nr:hypothetical protein Fuma_02999 [Fuerstiella marisgermanici]